MWAQAICPLWAQLKELREANPNSWGDDNTLEPELAVLKNGEQVFMAIRPKIILALDSILRIQRASGVQFFCPPLKGVDKQTQERVTNWIQKLHRFSAHTHSLDLKESQAQRCPRVEQLQGTKTTQLLDK